MPTQCSEWTADLGHMASATLFVQGRAPLFPMMEVLFGFYLNAKGPIHKSD